MTKSKLIINFLLFQLGWLLCVAGGASKWHVLGTLAVFLIVIYHLSTAQFKLPELWLIISAMGIGLIWDSLLLQYGVLSYSYGLVFDSLAPHWIIAMWALFATTFNVSLRWLKGKWLIAALFGAMGGPLAYFAGQKLGAVEIPNTSIAAYILALGWAAFMPFLLFLSSNLDGFAPANPVKETL